MADHVISISGAGELFRPDETRTVAGGGTRLVKMIPINEDVKLPCIWRSHKVTKSTDRDGNVIQVNQCLLLVCKNPPAVMAAEVAVDAWHNFPSGPVEW